MPCVIFLIRGIANKPLDGRSRIHLEPHGTPDELRAKTNASQTERSAPLTTTRGGGRVGYAAHVMAGNDESTAQNQDAGGALYVVATPIGNLEDISARALRILGSVDLVAAEDTRTTRKLLTRYDIRAPMVSLFDANVRRRLPGLLKDLADGKDIALVSEAGTPLISDPGVELVRAAAAAGHDVVPIPGPTAIAALLSVAGMPANRFTFLGFLPRKVGERRRLLEQVAGHAWPFAIYESPHRLLKSLDFLREEVGDREVVIGRELTKLYEESFRGTLSEAIEHFQKPRGEFTIVVAGAE